MMARASARRGAACSVVAAMLFWCAEPGFAYLRFGVTIGDRQVPLSWARSPARYFVSDRVVPGATVNATDFAAAVARAFATWQAVPTASVSYQFVGFTSASPGDDDGQSTLGFAARPDLNRVLASTSILLDQSTGEIIESDIFFNSAFRWSVAAAGETDRFDLESIALHEIGHFSGLGHSALGETEIRPDGGRRVIADESVMFPIAFPAGSIAGRTLRADDIAGISSLYPDAGFGETGSISGSVTRDGRGVFGAHIVAFNPATGSLVGGFTLDEGGRFTIGGLSPGPYVIRLEPLDDADLESFFDRPSIDVDFRVSFFDRLVVAPRGGDSGAADLKVVPK
jgi:hypothetical protein